MARLCQAIYQDPSARPCQAHTNDPQQAQSTKNGGLQTNARLCQAEENTQLRHNTVRATRPSGPGAKLVQRMVDVTVNYVIKPINVCSGTGISDLAMWTADEQLRADGIKITLETTHRYEIDDDAEAMAEKLMATFPDYKYKNCGPMNENNELEAISQLEVGTIVYRQSATPCQSLSRGISYLPMQSKVGPHAPPSNLMWQDVTTSSRINKARRCHISVKEQVVPAFEAWEVEMQQHMGYKKQSQGSTYPGCAVRDRYYFVSPNWVQELSGDVQQGYAKLDNTQYVLQRRRKPFTFEIRGEEYTWPIWEHSASDRPPTLKSVYPNLLARKADPQECHPLQNSEMKYVQKLMLQPANPRLPRLHAGPLQLATWLGLTPYQAQEAISPFPCLGVVDVNKGQPKEHFVNKDGTPKQENGTSPPEESYSLCQEKRLCDNCSRAAKLLGTAWCLPGAAEIIYKTLISALAMQSTQRPWHNFDFGHPHETHECGPQCHMAVTKGQAERQFGPVNMDAMESKRRKTT